MKPPALFDQQNGFVQAFYPGLFPFCTPDVIGMLPALGQ
jgi:hypothetical protein